MATSTTIYFHPQRGAIVVRSGFSWPACLLGSAWALAQRLGPVTCVVLLAMDVGAWLIAWQAWDQGDTGPRVASVVLLVLLAAWRGWAGHELRRGALLRAGYLAVDERRKRPRRPSDRIEPTFLRRHMPARSVSRF